jgi:hypothetical protein
MININNKNKWAKFDEYVFINKDYIGPKHLINGRIKEPSYYDAWRLYEKNKNKTLKSGEIQDQSPHLQLYKIGKFLHGEDSSDCSDKTKKYFFYKKAYEKKEVELLQLIRKDDYNDEEVNEEKDSIEFELNEILQKKNKYEDYFIHDKKKKILKWVNKFGLPGRLFETVDKIILPPQWIPFCESFNPSDKVERIPPSSYDEFENEFIFEEWWKQIDANYINKDLPNQITKQIEESVFYNIDHIKIFKKNKKKYIFRLLSTSNYF